LSGNIPMPPARFTSMALSVRATIPRSHTCAAMCKQPQCQIHDYEGHDYIAVP
jgi:hypothetical protein